MATDQKKWLEFYRLRDAFLKPGCAICQLATEDSLKILRRMLDEFASDVQTRTWLQASDGFCNWHAWLAVRIPDADSPLGTIYETIVEKALKRLTVAREAIAKAQAPPQALEPTRECPICHYVMQSESNYLNELLTWFND